MNDSKQIPRKILTVVGTRPEAIKLAPVIMELNRRPRQFTALVCATGQHRQMLDQALAPFQIIPEYDLNIMQAGQTLAEVTSRIIMKMDELLQEVHPDIVLVQGDTATAFGSSLAAFYQQIQVAHVEAGLRTHNKYFPFPEEINRRLIAQVTDYHFAPTEIAGQALLSEGFPPDSIHVTGNTVIDALLWIRERVRRQRPWLPQGLAEALTGPMVLVTGHRRESFGEGFKEICQAIREVAEMFPDVVFVYPVHLNPNVREPVWRILGDCPHICLIDPLPYESFVWLMDQATLVLTDSGGVQEEAPSLGKPVLVMRENTERPEGIATGNARLVGVKRASIVASLVQLLTHPEERNRMGQVQNPYGDGKASARIADILAQNSR